METLESSRVCRLCGKHSGISINIFDKNESHVKKINAVLPIMVHEMDLLPKHMCHRCSYKLEEFHKFYVDCLKTDADLKSQLSWMRKGNSKERIDVPMVHIENLKIKIEPPEYDVYELDPIVENVNYINSMSSVAFPVNGVRQSNGIHDGIAYAAYAPRCDCYCDKNNQSRQAVPKEYENRTAPISRCTGGMNNPTTNALQAVKKNLFTEDNLIQKCQSNLSGRKETKRRKLTTEIKNIGSSTSTATENTIGDTRIKNTVDSTNNAMVRNLRPRKGPIDYMGTKRKSFLATGETNPVNRLKSTEIKTTPSSSVEFAISRVKIEKTEDFEGRTLRPRNKLIDYSTKRPWKSRSEGTYCAKRHKGNAEVTENDSTLFQTKKPRPDIKITIKREPLDFEDTPKPSKKSRSTTRVVRNLSQRVEGVLPNSVHTMSNVSEYSRSNEEKRDDFHLNAKPKSLTIMAKRRVRDSLKYLRNFDAHLRNGKVRTFDEIVEKKVKKLRKNLGCAKVSTDQLKLLENIKHYCEKCNLSFANKELYKLHACYD